MFITEIAGIRLETGKFYKVTFQGDQASKRYSGAIWQFKERGKGGVARGDIVYHWKDAIVTKYKGRDNYISPKTFVGTIEEFVQLTCAGVAEGTEHVVCARGNWNESVTQRQPEVEWQSAITTVTGATYRCYRCESEHANWLTTQSAVQKQQSIEDELQAAIDAKRARRSEAMPVGTGTIIRVRPRTTEAESNRVLAAHHELAHKVPTGDFANSYIHRNIAGHGDFEALDYARETKKNVLLFGPTASSKTSLVYAYGAARGLPVVSISCNKGVDPLSLFGQQKMRDGSSWYEEGNVTKVFRHGGIIYLDEVNYMPTGIAAVFHEALDARRQVTIPELGYETIDLHPQCMIIGAFNPVDVDIRPLSIAFRRRFKLPLEWGYNDDVEKVLIRRLPTLLAMTAELRAEIDNNHTIETPVAPDTLEEFEEQAIRFGIDFAKEIFLNSFLAWERGTVSEVFTHFEAKLAEELAIVTAEN